MKPAEIARRIGFKNVSKGVRRLEALSHGDLSPRTKFVMDALPSALDVPVAEVQAAIQATMDQIAEAQRAQEATEERAYRAAFRPHAIWVTERDRPTSIVMACFYGIERLLRHDLDEDQGAETFVAQALAAIPSSVGFFGETRGFAVNYSPDRCVEYDAKGNVMASFPRARRVGSVDVTLRNDSRSILPLFQVEPLKD